jgi:hypothetical protein
MKLYGLALAGRVFFGFGGESLGVASSSLLALWFKGKEMALAMGIQLSISRLGSAINVRSFFSSIRFTNCYSCSSCLISFQDWASPPLQTTYSTSFAFWFGAFVSFLFLLSLLVAMSKNVSCPFQLCALSWVAAIMIAVTEIWAQKKAKEAADQEALLNKDKDVVAARMFCFSSFS